NRFAAISGGKVCLRPASGRAQPLDWSGDGLSRVRNCPRLPCVLGAHQNIAGGQRLARIVSVSARSCARNAGPRKWSTYSRGLGIGARHCRFQRLCAWLRAPIRDIAAECYRLTDPRNLPLPPRQRPTTSTPPPRQTALACPSANRSQTCFSVSLS